LKPKSIVHPFSGFKPAFIIPCEFRLSSTVGFEKPCPTEQYNESDFEKSYISPAMGEKTALPSYFPLLKGRLGTFISCKL
jgi:hypothetical protein